MGPQAPAIRGKSLEIVTKGVGRINSKPFQKRDPIQNELQLRFVPNACSADTHPLFLFFDSSENIILLTNKLLKPLLLQGGGDLAEDTAGGTAGMTVFLLFLAFLRVVFGQRPEDCTSQRAQHAVASGLVAGICTRGSAGHCAEQAAVCCAIGVGLSGLIVV
jgi:hypothetical protein